MLHNPGKTYLTRKRNSSTLNSDVFMFVKLKAEQTRELKLIQLILRKLKLRGKKFLTSSLK